MSGHDEGQGSAAEPDWERMRADLMSRTVIQLRAVARDEKSGCSSSSNKQDIVAGIIAARRRAFLGRPAQTGSWRVHSYTDVVPCRTTGSRC